MMSKRGVSAVVATVLLVLITIVAAVFIAGFVIPFVRDNLESSGECLGHEEDYKFYEGFGYNCYKINSAGQTTDYLYALSIEAKNIPVEKSKKIKGLKIQFYSDGESKGVEIFQGAVTNEESGGVRMLDRTKQILELPESGEVKTYVYTADKEYDSVEIYPVLKNNRVCEMNDKIFIRRVICAQDTLLD